MRGPMLTRRRALLAGGALAAACALPGAAAARPYGLEDALACEGLGDVLLVPGDRWLVVEQRRGRAAAGRFDYDLLNDLFRTTLMVADLDRPGPLRPLFPHDPAAGYQLGPASPDGVLLAVFRLLDDRWEAGIVTLATGAVLWLTPSVDLNFQHPTLAWISPLELALIAAGPEGPLDLRAMRPWMALPARRDVQARGGASYSLYGSGRFLGVRGPSPTKRLLKIDAASGAVEALAQGAFVDLEVSPDGARIALLARDGDIPLQADQQVQGDLGIATGRLRLNLLDLATRSLVKPLPQDDLLGTLLGWSPRGDALLVFGRKDGDPWPAGRLLRIDAKHGVIAASYETLVAPAISGRPEAVFAGWLGDDPILLGRSPRAARDSRNDWFRLTRTGALCLTGAMPVPPSGHVAIYRDRLVLSQLGRIWTVGGRGDAKVLSRGGAVLFDPQRRGLRARLFYRPARPERLIGLCAAPAGTMVGVLGGPTPSANLALPPGAELLAYSAPRNAAATMARRGGARTLSWVAPVGPPVALASLNKALAEVDPPIARPVRHPGPNGEALTSWLLLPKGGAPGRRPMVVYPYPGKSFPAPPAEADPGDDRIVYPPALLVGHGYAVLMPSLPTATDGRGPGEGLGQQILSVVDAALRQHDDLDPDRLGVLGHSFGGYAVLAALTQTDRFKAGVAMAGPSDLLSKWGEFSQFTRVFGDEGPQSAYSMGWVEDLQGGMGAPPWRALAKYLANSPLLQADKITTPLLIIHGEYDSMAPQEGERMFSALFRQAKDAEILTFWGEGHVIESPGNLRALYGRIFDWLDPVLKPPRP